MDPGLVRFCHDAFWGLSQEDKYLLHAAKNE